MIFDTHAHYDDPSYDGDRDELIEEMSASDVGAIINCSTDYLSCEDSIKLAAKHKNVFAAVGIYPHKTHKLGQWDKQKMYNYATSEKVVAIGEIGLDYFYDDSPKETQKYWLTEQILLANELDLPILFHNRDAHADTLDILKRLKPKGVIHCFTGSVQMAREIVKLNMHIGLGGVVTFKNARVSLEVARDIPLSHLLLETDAPYMSPVPYRGKRNRSDYISFIAEKIAEIRGISTEEVIRATEYNAKQLFKIN